MSVRQMLAIGSAMLVTLAVPGCSVSEKAIGPRQLPIPTIHKDVSSSGQPMIWDNSGRSYTLDAPNQRIVASTGEIIDLDGNETAEAANAFIQTSQDAGDYLDNMLQNNPPPADTGYATSLAGPSLLVPQAGRQTERTPSPDAGLPKSLGFYSRAVHPLAIPNARPGSHGTPSNGKPPWVFRRVDTHAPPGHKPPAPHTVAHSLSLPTGAGAATTAKSPAGVQVRFDVTSMYGSLGTPSCLDIARQIADMTPAWRSARDAWLDALGKALPMATWDPTTGELHVKAPDVQAAIDYDQAAFNLATQTTQLNIMAVFYSEYGCFNNTWPDASGTTVADVAYVCSDETWQISTDGGDTWSDVDVEDCQYQI